MLNASLESRLSGGLPWALDFEDLVTALAPPPTRVGKADGDHEQHFYEGAVMIAYAMHLLRAEGRSTFASTQTASTVSSSISLAG
jgi:hypothetical protein